MGAVAVFMDLTSAFDTVYHNGLLYKLYAMNLPTTIIRCINNFLTGRTNKKDSGNELTENIDKKEECHRVRHLHHLRATLDKS